MEKKKNKNNKYKYTFYFLLIFFTTVYIGGKTGYYETNIKKNTVLTNEAILNFEKDIAEGKAVDIKDYIKAEVPDYRNLYSKTGDKISGTLDTFLNEGVSKISKFLKALFT